MILEIDFGNSSLKWRIVSAPAEQPKARGRASAGDDLIKQIRAVGFEVRRCRLVSVRGALETELLCTYIGSALGIPITLAESTAVLGGVSNGYDEVGRLGADRWLAMVAAFRRARGACIVIDLGTAITVDYVSGAGDHLGGYIAPGFGLLRRALLQNTCRVRFAEGPALSGGRGARPCAPGRNTGAGVEGGCRHMVSAFIQRVVTCAPEGLGEPSVFVTGGDARLVVEATPSIKVIEDLVFEGLAIACP